MIALDHRLANRIERVNTPVLYHYCSGETLISILSNKTVRACDLDKMNDYLEYKWGLEVLSDAAKLSEEKTSKEFIDGLMARVPNVRTYMLPIIACFSMDGDVLSQWRAYSNDGDGFSVGFHTDAIRDFPGNIFNVVYDRGIQLQLMRDHLESEFRRWSKLKKADQDEDLEEISMVLAADICLFKNSCFSEEREVRLIYLLRTEEYEDGRNCTLFDPREDKSEIEGVPNRDSTPIQYAYKRGMIVPFCDFRSDVGTEELISSVIIGPKSRSEDRDLQHLLSAHGHVTARSLRSKASYR